MSTRSYPQPNSRREGFPSLFLLVVMVTAVLSAAPTGCSQKSTVKGSLPGTRGTGDDDTTSTFGSCSTFSCASGEAICFCPTSPAVVEVGEEITITVKGTGNRFDYLLSSGGGSIEVLPTGQIKFVSSASGLNVLRVTDENSNTRNMQILVGSEASRPNDPRYSEQWGYEAIQAPETWAARTSSAAITVAVIDTGVDLTHPDLVNNLWTNPNEVADGADNDGNGLVDDRHGYNFIGGGTASPMDDFFHGTHVAGTIGAQGNNSVGVSGVAWSASIMALKFLGSDGLGDYADAIEALTYATAKGAKVLNNSWGGSIGSTGLRDAIRAARDAGIIFVASSGNGGGDGIGDNNDASGTFPASYGDPRSASYSSNVIAVAATDNTDALTSFSNYGLNSVHIAAPGNGILSTFPTYMTSAMTGYGLSTNYMAISGTSMAAPHVSGAIALVWAANPTATMAQIKDLILNTADEIPGFAGKVGYGPLNAGGRRLNVYRALYGATP